MSRIRLVFMGTPPLAATVLEALLARREFEVVSVVTQPDQPKGRDLKLQPSAVKELALRNNLPVLQPERARDPEFIEQVRLLAPDVAAVAAYGQILPQPLLDVPRFGCLNVHTSLLPKYRGAAPIQWAILNGDPETGVTIMKMNAGLDTGDIVAMERTAIQADDNAQTLHDRLAQLGGALLARVIPEYVAAGIVPQPQPQEGSTYARKIKKEDGQLDWRMSATVLWNRVRGLTPWPGTFTHLQRTPPLMLKIHRVEVLEESGQQRTPGEILSVGRGGIVVACGEGLLGVLELQREGGKRMAAEQFLAGCAIQAGERLA
jgi:methionyl-tRNA formyltransferase